MRLPSKWLALLCAGLASQGCGYGLSMAMGGDTRTRHTLTAQEPDAKLYCGGEPCDRVTVEASSEREMSPLGYAIGVGLDIVGTAYTFSHLMSDTTDPVTGDTTSDLSTPMFLGAVLFGTLLTLDVMGLVKVAAIDEHGGFERHDSCCTLVKPTEVEWQGRRAELPESIVRQTGRTEFSAEEAIAFAGGGKLMIMGKKGLLPEGAKLAVLDFKAAGSGVRIEDVRYFSDVVRKLAIGVKPRLTVMTKESMVVALEAATGGKCDDECEVDTGRKVGADGLVSGELVKVGSQLKLQLKLHDTKSGQLLSAGTASGANLQELEKSLETVGDQLLREK